MGIKTQVKMLDLLKKIVAGEMSTISYIENKSLKELMGDIGEDKFFERCTPESQGISSEYLRKFIECLGADSKVNCHGVMILRNGKVILEGSYAPFSNNIPQITHSLAKSITAIAIGMAYDEGVLSLDENVGTILGKTYLPVLGKRNKEITIKHLLTMSSGISFNEVGSVIEEDWQKEYLDSNVLFEPGTKFAYNSMNTYMLSVIIKEKTGLGLMEYLKPRLFEPLGIKNVFWETCPKGIEKGGWGFYINMEDRAKIAQLLLDKGKWKDKQLLSETYIDAMTKRQMITPASQNKYGYGYQVWMANRKKSFLFNGVLGQNAIVYPDLNMIILFTAGNNELFVNSHMMDIVERFFNESVFLGEENPKDKVLPENKLEHQKLMETMKELMVGTFPKPVGAVSWRSTKQGFHYYGGWNHKRKLIEKKTSCQESFILEQEFLYEKEYVTPKSEVSIIPLFIQCMQNNYSKGLNRIKFLRKQEKFWIQVQEGELIYDIPIGFDKSEYTVIHLNDEPYRIGTKGVLLRNEDNVLVLKIIFSFVEMTNSSMLKFHFYEERAVVKFCELPDLREVANDVIPFLKFSLPSNAVEMIKNFDIIQQKMTKILAPEFEMTIQK